MENIITPPFAYRLPPPTPMSPLSLPPPAIALTQHSNVLFPKKQFVQILCDQPIKIHNKEVFNIIWLDENSFYLISTENRPF